MNKIGDSGGCAGNPRGWCDETLQSAPHGVVIPHKRQVILGQANHSAKLLPPLGVLGGALVVLDKLALKKGTHHVQSAWPWRLVFQIG
jgi:hypothetical protein